MELGLDDRLVLVTGSTEGIGFSIASAFLKAGAQVVVNGRNQSKVDAAVQKLQQEYSSEKVLSVAADVSTDAGVEKVEERVKKTGKDLYALVNNVGIYASKDFFECDIEEWQKMFNVNVFSMVRLSKVFLKKMLEKNEGRIINIASEAGMRPLADMLHYSTSKTAVIGLTRGLAELTRNSNVTCNSLLVGTTMTPGVQEYVTKMAETNSISFEEQSSKFFTEFDRAFSLIQRFIKPEEIGKICVFLGSSAASCMNGAAIRAEGGMLGHL